MQPLNGRAVMQEGEAKFTKRLGDKGISLVVSYTEQYNLAILNQKEIR